MKIRKLTLFTTRIEPQIQFYRQVLGLPIKQSNKDSVQFQIGKTELELRFKENATPYHFAINIPCNKEHEAMQWLKQRVTVLKDNALELIDFSDWNAKAMYFYDEDNNIVEFIARKNLDNQSNAAFDIDQLLEISEIGLPCDHIEDIYNQLHEDAGLEIYSGSLNVFCAIGDERGLFICIDKNKKKWFPIDASVTNADEINIAYASDFNALIEVKGKVCSCTYLNGALSITSEIGN